MMAIREEIDPFHRLGYLCVLLSLFYFFFFLRSNFSRSRARKSNPGTIFRPANSRDSSSDGSHAFTLCQEIDILELEGSVSLCSSEVEVEESESRS